MGVQGSVYPLQVRLLERTQPESHAVRNELTIANEPEHHTRGTTWPQLRHQLYNHPNLDTHEGWPV